MFEGHGPISFQELFTFKKVTVSSRMGPSSLKIHNFYIWPILKSHFLITLNLFYKISENFYPKAGY
ncbi:hypothetical protein BpHYR1_042892 [Brachionus plicatilis]|uniref:Uncharacterized protein n=1 Tax=Brachionus plicatilis TaxID=10195 RepID=A0A3M7RKT5_BRAPC|nr:hypothetical protein BpHYR1_042892 [Brachionus plicatilis]